MTVPATATRGGARPGRSSLVLVAHGSRKPEGVAMIGDLAERVGNLLRQPVRVAFVDVLGPTPAEVLAALTGAGRSAIVVPAFLSRGYHVRVDLPAQVRASGHHRVAVRPALGPGPQIVHILVQRLLETSWRPGDPVVLAAAGTSDPVGRADLTRTARKLSRRTGSRVTLAFAATGEPGVADAVCALRARGASRVTVSSYLLADGLFQERLQHCGADRVARPLGTHPAMVGLVAERFNTDEAHSVGSAVSAFSRR